MNDVRRRKTVLIASIASVLTLYLFWELYWYTQVGLVFVKWHTHLMIYAYLAVIIYCSYNLLSINAGNLIKNIFLAISSVLFTLFIGEVFLSISHIYETDIEKIAGGYVSPYEISITRNPYHIWPAGKSHRLEDLEFKYIRSANSMGFTDPEWKLNKKANEIRILALGDSFTEGDGAPYDSSYVALMRHILLSKGNSFYVMNGGTCGSDPFFNYVNLRDRLLAYKPDIVIQSIGSGDMNSDILVRGGMERFENGGPLIPPWWEPLYAISYVSRIFFTFAGYDQLLQKPFRIEVEKGRINRSVEYLFRDYSALCRKNHIKLFVVLHPQKDELENGAYGYDFTPVVQSMVSDGHINVVDLLPSYRAYIDSTHTTAADYYWEKNGHHNPKGYLMMAETTLQNISPFLYDSTLNLSQ